MLVWENANVQRTNQSIRSEMRDASNTHIDQQGSDTRRCYLCGPVDRIITRFKFPDDERRAEWLKFCNVENVHRFAMLCTKHFDLKDLKIESNRCRLRHGAIPTRHVSGENKIIRSRKHLREKRTEKILRRCYVCDRLKQKQMKTLFKFPDDERRAKWLEFCHAENVDRYALLCMKHFKPQDIVTVGNWRRLKSSAIPVYISGIPFTKTKEKRRQCCYLCGPTMPNSYTPCFLFPTDNRRVEWLRFCKVKNPRDIDSRATLCVAHFKHKDFIPGRGRRRLRSDAVPSRCQNSMESSPVWTKDQETELPKILLRKTVNCSTSKSDSNSPTEYELLPTFRSERDKSPSVEQRENVSSSSTVTSTSTASTGACSSSNELDWENFLDEMNGKVAPLHCFKQFPEPPENKFENDMILEARDPRNTTSNCIARVIKKCGPRLLVRLEGDKDETGFWTLVDSDEIQAVGTAEKNNDVLQPPSGFDSSDAVFDELLAEVLRLGVKAPEDIFIGEPSTPRSNYFEPGQKLEAVDQNNRDLICVATVEKVEKDLIYVSFDGYEQPVGYFFKYYSRDLFPVGWCKKSGHPLSIPGRESTVNRKRKVQDTSSGTHTDPASTSSPASDAVVKSSATAPELPHDPSKWSAEDVVTYISCSDPSLSGYADLFQRHEIDGKALLLLNAKMLIKHLGLKLGPAVKIAEIISRIKY